MFPTRGCFRARGRPARAERMARGPVGMIRAIGWGRIRIEWRNDMKLNLLATTAAAALVASGGAWAQAQAPGPKHDEKTQMHEQKGAAQQNRDEKRAGKERSDQGKSAQQASDAQQKANAAQGKTDAMKDASRASDHAQSKQPNAAAENQKGERRASGRAGRNTASEMHTTTH